jgi:hypothetical protein
VEAILHGDRYVGTEQSRTNGTNGSDAAFLRDGGGERRSAYSAVIGSRTSLGDSRRRQTTSTKPIARLAVKSG